MDRLVSAGLPPESSQDNPRIEVTSDRRCCAPGESCISQGATRDETLINIKEAIGLYIETLTNDHLPVPSDNLDAMLVAV
jgi:predicted RNase H-like HicB family nuclease